MSVSMALSLLVMVVGLVMYLWVATPKWQEVGRLSFAFGLLVSLLQMSGGVAITLFKR